MVQYLLRNMRLLDPERDEVVGGHEILIEDDKIREVREGEIASAEAEVVDCGGRTVMPGLIDCHVHVTLSDVFIRRLEEQPLTLMAAKSLRQMSAMLDRGFTTVRDTGGADWGLKMAVEEGLAVGPRLFIAGKAIGPTGGHSDGRRRTDSGPTCFCCNALSFVMCVADGPDQVRKAVREEMRQGCDQVKIMMSGGVASPYDPLESMQFSPAEVMTAVEEAEAFGRYVCAHAYSPEAITRAAECGVRTIEHGNLIDEAAAALLAEKNMFLVANLIAYYAMRESAADFGMPADMLEKNEMVIDGGLRSLEICKRAGVPVAFGSDLLGPLQVNQCREFALRAQVLSPIEIIRSATLIGAQVIRQEGKLGCVKPGAFADLLMFDGNPLEDLGLFERHEESLHGIMKGGQFHKNLM